MSVSLMHFNSKGLTERRSIYIKWLKTKIINPVKPSQSFAWRHIYSDNFNYQLKLSQKLTLFKFYFFRKKITITLALPYQITLYMKTLILLRLFLCFPLIGSLLPDAGTWLSNGLAAIPPVHLVIEAVLLITIAICSVRISVIKKREINPDDKSEHSAYEL
jgi:hypothetical protein